MKVLRLSSLRTGLLYPPGNIPGTLFCSRLSQPLGHSAVGRIMSVKISIDTIGNRARDLPTFSAVPQPPAPPRTPRIQVIHSKCLRVISNHPRHTPTFPPTRHCKRWTHPRYNPPNYSQICSRCASHTNPLVQQIGNYTVVDLANMCRVYKHKRTKHILLQLNYRKS